MIDENIPIPANDCPNCGGLGVIYSDSDDVSICTFCSIEYDGEFEDDNEFEDDDEFEFY